jgi:hypothetical protein
MENSNRTAQIDVHLPRRSSNNHESAIHWQTGEIAAAG